MYQNTPAAMPAPSLQGFNPSNANSFDYQAGNPDALPGRPLPNINQQLDPQTMEMLRRLMGQTQAVPNENSLPNNSNSGVGGQSPVGGQPPIAPNYGGLSNLLQAGANMVPGLLGIGG
jgi:hypothetical protein